MELSAEDFSTMLLERKPQDKLSTQDIRKRFGYAPSHRSGISIIAYHEPNQCMLAHFSQQSR